MDKAGDVKVRFSVEYAKSGRSTCKYSKCGQSIEQGTVRLGKVVPNPWASGDMTSWYHVDCLFESLQKGRSDTEKISDEDDIEGFYDLKENDQEVLRDRIGDSAKVMDELETADEKAVYLEDTNGDSEKFWQISISGSTTRVAWGNIGAAGFSQVKNHADEDVAEAFKEKMVKQKLKIGYKHAKKGEYRPQKSAAKSGGGGGGSGDDSGGLDGAEGLRYCVEYAKSGRSKCRNGKCKENIDEGEVRMGKIIRNPFTDSGADMTVWYHLKCMFESLKKSRAASIKIRGVDDVEGIDELRKSDKTKVEKLVEEEGEFRKSLESAGGGGTTKSSKTGRSTGRKATSGDVDTAEGSTAYFECETTDHFGRDEVKFWEITVAGVATQVRYGKKGESGFISAKKHGSNAAALKFKAKMVQEKEGKGYKLISGSKDDPPATDGDGDDDKPKKAKKAPAKKKAANKSGGKKRKRSDDDDDDDDDEERDNDDEADDYDNMTVAELKEDCETMGLSKSGKKADLIARLRGK